MTALFIFKINPATCLSIFLTDLPSSSTLIRKRVFEVLAREVLTFWPDILARTVSQEVEEHDKWMDNLVQQPPTK